MSASTRDGRRGGAAPNVRDLIGQPVEAAFERYGRATVNRRTGDDRWLRFEAPGWALRLRASPEPPGDLERPGDPTLVRSWTAVFERGFDSVAEALSALGLPPPDPSVEAGELRMPLRDGAGRVHSLTLSLRQGRIHAATGFDEPPEWGVETPLPDDAKL